MSDDYDYVFQCPLCGEDYGDNDVMSIYDVEYGGIICLHCSIELEEEQQALANNGDQGD